MEIHHLGWSAHNDSQEQIERLTRALQALPAPYLIHCKHGVDRTGAMMSVYRMEEEGWTNAEAFAEMEYFGAHKLWQDLRNFVKRYVPDKRRTAAARAPLGAR